METVATAFLPTDDERYGDVTPCIARAIACGSSSRPLARTVADLGAPWSSDGPDDDAIDTELSDDNNVAMHAYVDTMWFWCCVNGNGDGMELLTGAQVRHHFSEATVSEGEAFFAWAELSSFGESGVFLVGDGGSSMTVCRALPEQPSRTLRAKT